jgi:hypothetical protein
MTDTADRLLSYAQHKVHPLVQTWLDAETVKTNLRAELEGDLERLQSDALAAEFQHYCPVLGAGADDYKNRLFSVEGLELLTGIRFLGGDLTQPFVDVICSSEPTLTPELDHISDAVQREFAVFQPNEPGFIFPRTGPNPRGTATNGLSRRPWG